MWKAYDNKTGAVVAVKKLLPDLMRGNDLIRFRREMRNLASVSHPNVVRITVISHSRDECGYAMELCPGGDLSRWLGKRRADSEKLECFKQIASGVAALHEKGILHRDLKPANILLGADSNFKIADLGLSVSLATENRPTTSNWVSPGFSPPEQYRDMKTVTESGDIYSLGVVLYHLFTGKDSNGGLHIKNGSIPEPLRLLLTGMVSTNPKSRFRSVGAVVRALDTLLAVENPNMCICPRCDGHAIAWTSLVDFVYSCAECRYWGRET